MSATTQPLKYPGCKTWIGTILSEFYSDELYIAPFCGGLGDALSLKPKYAILSDVNPFLIEFWWWVQKHGRLEIDPGEFNEGNFLKVRSRFNELTQEFGKSAFVSERAQLFYILNRWCFNGLIRFNQKGEFNVPIGKYKNPKLRSDFFDIQPIIKNWDFRVSDFRDIWPSEGAFLYLDPPYDCEFTSYSGTSFTWGDQLEVANYAKDREGVTVISNQLSDRIVSLYQDCGFDLIYRDVKRKISCKGDRKPAKEVIAIKR